MRVTTIRGGAEDKDDSGGDTYDETIWLLLLSLNRQRNHSGFELVPR
jgi:hypothetical protein